MKKKFTDFFDSGFLLSGIIAWFAAIAVLILLAAFTVYLTEADETSLGYVISSLSFISGCAAGYASFRKKKTGAVFVGLITGCTCTVAALTLGFVISESSLTADGVLSVVTFTLTGALFGSLLPVKKKRSKKVNKSA